MKKLLKLGLVAATIVPIVSIVSCSSVTVHKNQIKEKTKEKTHEKNIAEEIPKELKTKVEYLQSLIIPPKKILKAEAIILTGQKYPTYKDPNDFLNLAILEHAIIKKKVAMNQADSYNDAVEKANNDLEIFKKMLPSEKLKQSLEKLDSIVIPQKNKLINNAIVPIEIKYPEYEKPKNIIDQVTISQALRDKASAMAQAMEYNTAVTEANQNIIDNNKFYSSLMKLRNIIIPPKIELVDGVTIETQNLTPYIENDNFLTQKILEDEIIKKNIIRKKRIINNIEVASANDLFNLKEKLKELNEINVPEKMTLDSGAIIDTGETYEEYKDFSNFINLESVTNAIKNKRIIFNKSTEYNNAVILANKIQKEYNKLSQLEKLENLKIRYSKIKIPPKLNLIDGAKINQNIKYMEYIEPASLSKIQDLLDAIEDKAWYVTIAKIYNDEVNKVNDSKLELNKMDADTLKLQALKIPRQNYLELNAPTIEINYPSYNDPTILSIHSNILEAIRFKENAIAQMNKYNSAVKDTNDVVYKIKDLLKNSESYSNIQKFALDNNIKNWKLLHIIINTFNDLHDWIQQFEIDSNTPKELAEFTTKINKLYSYTLPDLTYDWTRTNLQFYIDAIKEWKSIDEKYGV